MPRPVVDLPAALLANGAEGSTQRKPKRKKKNSSKHKLLYSLRSFTTVQRFTSEHALTVDLSSMVFVLSDHYAAFACVYSSAHCQRIFRDEQVLVHRNFE